MLLVLAMALSLVACGGSSAPAATEAPKAEAPAATEAAAPEAPAVEEVTLNVAYMANWGSLWAVATAAYSSNKVVNRCLNVFIVILF